MSFIRNIMNIYLHASRGSKPKQRLQLSEGSTSMVYFRAVCVCRWARVINLPWLAATMIDDMHVRVDTYY